MTYEEIVAVLDQHQYSKLAYTNVRGRMYDCECGERFFWADHKPVSGHAEHLAEKLIEAGMGG